MKKKEISQIIELRKKGYSLKEISELVGVCKSTASYWSKDIVLSEKAQKRLQTRVTAGQLASASTKRLKTEKVLENYYDQSYKWLAGREQGFDVDTKKLFCSLIYWCEGGKVNNRMVQFTNSDPDLISAFLTLLREIFTIDETKFRVCIHLHSYHDKNKQIEYWSKQTNIPEKQFIKPFMKANTGKRIRQNYQGCCQIRYYNSDVTRQLLMTGKAFLNFYRLLV